jgi:hypothetical protein
MDRWRSGKATDPALLSSDSPGGKLGTVCPEKASGKPRRTDASDATPPDWTIVATLSRQLESAERRGVVKSLVWSHQCTILDAGERADERYFSFPGSAWERTVFEAPPLLAPTVPPPNPIP